MKERNYGIDFLRILSMFMVVVLHVLGKGGVLYAARAGSTRYWVLWFLEIAAYCAVDCFALISGYVMLNAKTKISRISGLWLQTAFYTVLLTILFFKFVPETTITSTDVIKSFFPVSTKHYWYISAYFGMYILVPVLNAALQNIQKRTMEVSLVGMFLVFCILSLEFDPKSKYDPFILDKGYSVLWLCLLYLLGGYFKKYNIVSKVKKFKAFALFVSMTVVTFLSKYCIETFTTLTTENSTYGKLLVNYVSPTVLLAGVGLFFWASQLKFPKPLEKVISFFAPASLGVYLIHVCKPVWTGVIKDFSRDFVKYDGIKMLVLIAVSAVAIYLACSLIELLRIRLFKLLRINKLCLIIENMCTKVFDKIYLKFNQDENALSEEEKVLTK